MAVSVNDGRSIVVVIGFFFSVWFQKFTCSGVDVADRISPAERIPQIRPGSTACIKI